MKGTRSHVDVGGRAVDVQVMRLRRKLHYASRAAPVIRTERCLGYIFVPIVEQL